MRKQTSKLISVLRSIGQYNDNSIYIESETTLMHACTHARESEREIYYVVEKSKDQPISL